MPSAARGAAAALFVFLLVNSGYIAAYPAATLFYMGNVVAHLAVGLLLMAAALGAVKRYPAESGVFLAAGTVALFLVAKGNTLDHRAILWLHICLGVGAAALAALPLPPPTSVLRARLPHCRSAAGIGRRLEPRASRPQRPHREPAVRLRSPWTRRAWAPIRPLRRLPRAPPADGSSPSNFFMDSEACGECHKDIYEQWKSSMHHMASFNNQFYRKSIEYMQSVDGTRGSKWCAGCHDHAVFFNGRFDRPINEQIDTPEAQAGLGCMSCHAIVHVGSTMGNSDFTVEYPPAASNWLPATTGPSARSLPS